MYRADIENTYYNIKIYDQIYHVEHIYSWDERIALDYINIAEKLITDNLYGQPWALLIDYREWTLNTPEAEKLLNEHFSKGLRAGLSCVATIVEDSDIKKWQANRITMGYLPEKNQFFSDIFQAIMWLENLGYIDLVDDLEKQFPMNSKTR